MHQLKVAFKIRLNCSWELSGALQYMSSVSKNLRLVLNIWTLQSFEEG